MHLDYGYAVTSHSSQGQPANRVLIHVDTELGAKDLLNSRMAYVAVSRGAHDAQIAATCLIRQRSNRPLSLTPSSNPLSYNPPTSERLVRDSVSACKSRPKQTFPG